MCVGGGGGGERHLSCGKHYLTVILNTRVGMWGWGTPDLWATLSHRHTEHEGGGGGGGRQLWATLSHRHTEHEGRDGGGGGGGLRAVGNTLSPSYSK